MQNVEHLLKITKGRYSQVMFQGNALWVSSKWSACRSCDTPLSLASCAYTDKSTPSSRMLLPLWYTHLLTPALDRSLGKAKEAEKKRFFKNERVLVLNKHFDCIASKTQSPIGRIIQ
jgi:hypothetical protein